MKMKIEIVQNNWIQHVINVLSPFLNDAIVKDAIIYRTRQFYDSGFHYIGDWDNATECWNYLNRILIPVAQDINVYARYYDNTPNDWQSNWAGTGKKFGMWQYTESKNIAPISGNIDCNVAYKNYPLIIKALRLNNFN